MSSSQNTISVTGGTVLYSAQVKDSKGKVLPGFPIIWTSSNPTVATVDQSGLATAVGPGVTLIRAHADHLLGQDSLTVALVPSRTEIVSGDGQVGLVGNVLSEPLRVQVVDGSGAPISGVSVTFSVLQGGGVVSPSTATTGAEGIASVLWTLGPDPEEQQKVAASVGILSAEFGASATWPPPRVMTTALGYGRSTMDYAGRLEAEGGDGTTFVWSLQGGSLPPGVSLSPQGELAGTPTEEGSFLFSVQVQDSEEAVATGEVAMEVCSAPTPYAPGEVRVFHPTAANGCGFFLPAGEAGDGYRVGIVRSETNRDSEDVLYVTLEVEGVGVQAIPAPVPAPFRTPWLPHFPASLQEAEEIARATEAYHLELREEERQMLAGLPPGTRPLPSFPSGSPVVQAARQAAAPTSLMLNFPENGCAGVAAKPALLIGENENIAIYQDSLQRATEPVGSVVVRTMLDYYRDYGRRVIDGYFGGVSDVNGDGQVVVYVTPGIRDGVAGFVRSSDLLGQEVCASSNQMEITYLKASFVNGFDSGNYQVVGTLVHEIKHISSLYRRLVAGRFHPSWVEEGTAEIATDRASRLALAETGGPGMGEMLSLDDVVTYGRTVEGYNTLMRLSRSLRYMASQPNSITVNPDGAQFMSASGPQSRHTIYGAGWHFHRWLGDAYGGAATPFADSLLFSAQNDSLSLGGPGAYPDLVGRTFSELMEEYAAAVMLNGTGAPQPPRAFTSVDFPSAMSSTLVYSASTRPLGVYPWPVNAPGEGAPPVSLTTATYRGLMGESGLRIHDFTSNGTGQGAEVTVFAPTQARVVVVRVR